MSTRESVVSGLHTMPATEAIRAVAAVATVRSSEDGPLRTRWNELAAIATAPSPDRTMVAVLANLDETDRALVATLVAALTQPGLAVLREQVRLGTLGLTVEDGEVTWLPIIPRDVPRREIRLKVLAALTRVAGVGESDLLARERNDDCVCFARQIGMSIYRELTGASWERVGDAFGKTHGAALHGRHVVDTRCETSARDRMLVDRVRLALGMTPWTPATKETPP
jgi:hypothetical protein